MDNLTHTLLGIVVARSGLRQKLGKGTTTVLALASNLPDLDVFTFFLKGGDYFLFRRTFTHSFLGVFLMGLVFSFVFKRWFKNLSWKVCLGLCLLGMGLHISLDLLNAYGVVLLYPWSFHRFELAWVFVINFLWWVILISPFVLTRFSFLKPLQVGVYRISVLISLVYIAFCGAGHCLSEKLLNEKIKEQKIIPSLTYVFPEPLGFIRFQGLIKEKDHYQIFLISPLTSKLVLEKLVHTEENDSKIQKLKKLPKVQKLEWFFKAPVWEKINNSEASKDASLKSFKFYDLRFETSIFSSKRTPFSFQFDVQDKKNH